MQESKAIIFPKEVQDQLDVITKKMINTLSELDKENKDPEKEKYRRVGSIVFNDPYTKEQENEKAYNVFAVKPTEKNKTISGFHSVYEGEPIISVTTNVGRNYDSVYNILAHELTHAYDPTIARGYRNPMGSALQDGKKTKLTPYFNPYKDYSNQEGKQDAYDKYFEQEPEFLANVSAYANYMINSALRDTKNDSPDLLFVNYP